MEPTFPARCPLSLLVVRGTARRQPEGNRVKVSKATRLVTGTATGAGDALPVFSHADLARRYARARGVDADAVTVRSPEQLLGIVTLALPGRTSHVALDPDEHGQPRCVVPVRTFVQSLVDQQARSNG
jgi:hypothetical protein